MNIITLPEGVCAGLVETVLKVPVRLRGDVLVSTATQHRVDAAGPALLAAARMARIEALTQACAAAIVGGFTSDALGAVHRYPSAITDQANLVQAAACADGGPLWCGTWCADGDLAWSFAAHTRDQAAQVLAAFVTTRTALQTRLATLTAAVDAAVDTAALAAVTWGEGEA